MKDLACNRSGDACRLHPTAEACLGSSSVSAKVGLSRSALLSLGISSSPLSELMEGGDSTQKALFPKQ